jgi:TetR/AcrR family transcriptional regulator, transcriptional repressor for nem operon
MRVSKTAMAAHHEAIISTASRMLREQGIQGVSVADLMKAAGLTHGGFYRHFASKEALVAEATSAAFDARLALLNEKAVHKGHKVALEEFVAEYLSQRHIENPGMGCPIAAYGAEVAHEGAVVRTVFNDGVDRLAEWMSGGLSTKIEDRKGKAAQLLCLMVGAIVTARATGDRSWTREILRQARLGANCIMTKGR